MGWNLRGIIHCIKIFPCITSRIICLCCTYCILMVSLVCGLVQRATVVLWQRPSSHVVIVLWWGIPEHVLQKSPWGFFLSHAKFCITPLWHTGQEATGLGRQFPCFLSKLSCGTRHRPALEVFDPLSVTGRAGKHLGWPTPTAVLGTCPPWDSEGHAEFAELSLSPTPSGSFVVYSVIAECDNANEKGRDPVRTQLASGTPVSIKKKKSKKGRGEGEKNPQK